MWSKLEGTSLDSVFVGRGREINGLRSRLRDAAAGRGNIVMLAGEPGIGKTCTARALAAFSREEGHAVLWGSCFEGDLSMLYGPWVAALSAYARAAETGRLQAQLGAGVPALAQLVPDIRAAMPLAPIPAQLSPDETRFRLFDAIMQFLLAIAREHCVLLILDDLHWADPDSLRLLRYVARFVAQARLLLVGIYRSTELDLERGTSRESAGRALLLTDTLAVIRHDADNERMMLVGLSVEEVAVYLSHAAGRPLPQALVEAIYAETGGNPFFTREIVRHLREGGKLTPPHIEQPADWDGTDLGIPDGVRQVLVHRLAMLSAEYELRAPACSTGARAGGNGREQR